MLQCLLIVGLIAMDDACSPPPLLLPSPGTHHATAAIVPQAAEATVAQTMIFSQVARHFFAVTQARLHEVTVRTHRRSGSAASGGNVDTGPPPRARAAWPASSPCWRFSAPLRHAPYFLQMLGPLNVGHHQQSAPARLTEQDLAVESVLGQLQASFAAVVKEASSLIVSAWRPQHITCAVAPVFSTSTEK